MPTPVISVENLSKSYLIGHQGPRERYHSLRDSLAHGAKSLFHKARKLATGQANLRTASIEEFWALKDVSFEVQQGEVLGIIGRNGAGKSTLLKVLSRITEPSSGRVTLHGRVASLLEVGTGFHPELTGRENLYLNGAILGMSRKEITRKFDEIVDFAGVEKFLDTPVKRYSSGMYVRLAFAVAAHLEPEILIVDEVLAVGDAEFQKKCMGKMQDVAGGGRTVLFVSHSMAAISALCTRTVVVSHGQKIFDGETQIGIQTYLKSGIQTNFAEINFPKLSEEFWLSRAQLTNEKGSITNVFHVQDAIKLSFFCECSRFPQGLELTFNVESAKGQIVFTSERKKPLWPIGKFQIDCTIPSMFLVPGSYSINIAVHIPNVTLISHHENALSFNIEETGSGMDRYQTADQGVVIAPCQWQDL